MKVLFAQRSGNQFNWLSCKIEIIEKAIAGHFQLESFKNATLSQRLYQSHFSVLRYCSDVSERSNILLGNLEGLYLRFLFDSNGLTRTESLQYRRDSSRKTHNLASPRPKLCLYVEQFKTETTRKAN